MIAAAKAGDWTQLDDGTVVGRWPDARAPASSSWRSSPPRDESPRRCASNDAVVELDVEVTDELRDEGRARDVVRAVQQARKDAELARDGPHRRLNLSTGDELAASLAPTGGGSTNRCSRPRHRLELSTMPGRRDRRAAVPRRGHPVD